MKVLVLGSGGMAGHVIYEYLSQQRFDVIELFSRRQLDVMNTLQLDRFIEHNKPDIIVNCIGVLIGQADKDKARTVYLNSYLPHYLSSKARVIHISTDCVFSGNDGYYRENDQKDSDTFYGQSKALGELDNDKDLTFRMSIIGPELKDGEGLFNWFMKQSGEIDGYQNSLWNGITTIELAHGVEAAIKQNLTGLYHLVPDEELSKGELLHRINVEFEKGITINKIDNDFDNKKIINTRNDFKYRVRGYNHMIHQMKDWMMNHKELYGRYL